MLLELVLGFCLRDPAWDLVFNGADARHPGLLILIEQPMKAFSPSHSSQVTSTSTIDGAERDPLPKERDRSDTMALILPDLDV